MTTMARECRSPLELCGNIPSTVADLRLRWYSTYRSIFVDFMREINHWSLSEEAAADIVDSRVGAFVNNCCAQEIDAFLLWVWLRLSGKDDEATFFEYADADGRPDVRELCSGNRSSVA